MITLHNELCCTYARLVVRWVARFTAYLRTARGAGCALDAGHAAADRPPDNGPLAPVR